VQKFIVANLRGERKRNLNVIVERNIVDAVTKLALVVLICDKTARCTLAA
jgi:hypothetical protein